MLRLRIRIDQNLTLSHTPDLSRATAAGQTIFPSEFRCVNLSPQLLRPFVLHHLPPMAALSPFFSTSFSLFSCRPPDRRFFSHWRPPLAISCSASAGKSRRASRRLMNDADLRNGLLEFVSSFGFPDGHVPSTKELTEHGRKDLANIVRRRGYKIIKELLVNSNGVTGGSDLEDSSVEEKNVVHGLQYDIAGQDKQDKDGTKVALDSPEGVPSSEDRLQTKTESDVNLDNKNDVPIVPPNVSSLQEKVEKFLKYGTLDFDAVEDNINGKFWLDDSQAYGEYSKNSNGGDVYISHEVPSNAGVEQYISIKDIEMENQAEVEELKHKLQLKELELSQMRELIEKEEEALSILQSQAEDEIMKTEKLISEMDAEVIAVEDSLAGLKEVQIQYLGEGHLVEVAGSFNGWQQRIRMDPQPSSTGKAPIELRNPTRWSALLWLYPGEYEIKFVVDGEWKIDPKREITTRTGIQNNILRVDR